MKKTIKNRIKAPTPSPAPTKPLKAAIPSKKQAAAPAQPPTTFISAKVDIGFGNTLFVRGDAPGLFWDKGTPMECVTADLWTIAIQGATKPVVFKFLVNDIQWSSGEDYAIAPGQSATLTPAF
ncbi:MAG: hypothetical protein PHQ04_12005 [Opitutaceae bacterium]|nr:hypothetical protein [Opitutaceae bacterium]